MRGGRKRKETIPLPPCPAPPSFAEWFLFSCFELWILYRISCGYQGQPEGRRWVIAIQMATNCNSNKASAQGLIRYKGTRCPQVDALPFREFHLETSQCVNTAAEIAAGAAVLGALSWSEVLDWAEESREIRFGAMAKSFLTIFCLSFVCVSVSPGWKLLSMA